MDDHSNESLLEVEKTLDHHKAEVTSVSYDGTNIISGDIQGYINNSWFYITTNRFTIFYAF